MVMLCGYYMLVWLCVCMCVKFCLHVCVCVCAEVDLGNGVEGAHAWSPLCLISVQHKSWLMNLETYFTNSDGVQSTYSSPECVNTYFCDNITWLGGSVLI